MTGHKVSLRKLKKIEIIPSIFSHHNDMKLDINNRRKAGKFTNIQLFAFLYNKWVREENKMDIKKYLETNKNGNTTPQNL